MGNYFYGWYFKCQNEGDTIAMIPAYHITNQVKSCSLQVITPQGSWNVPYPFSQFRMDRDTIQLGNNRFSKQGCVLDVQGEGLLLRGQLSFGELTPLAYDIMGPFRYVPFLECRHSVFSMCHRVDGLLCMNGRELLFDGGTGYLEGDRGRSFPREYLWTQCCFPEGSLMLSVADIPFCGFRFTGIIGAIRYRGTEYRLATYLGARAIKIRRGEAVIRQGGMTLTVRRLEDNGSFLAAPVSGDMRRSIRESVACRSYYHLRENGKTVFEHISTASSFEYEYSQ